MHYTEPLRTPAVTRPYWRLGLSLWLVLLVHFNPDGAAGPRFVYLTRAIVEHHSLNVDAYVGPSLSQQLLLTDTFVKDGHTWIDTNPGMSFLAIPAWSLYVMLARGFHIDELLNGQAAYYAAHFVTTATTTALATVLAALLLYRWVVLRTGSSARGLSAALLYTFGTNAFFLSTLLIQHSVVALVTLVLAIAVIDPEVLGAFHISKWKYPALGAACGLALLVDLSIVPALVILGPWLVLKEGTNTVRLRRALQLGLGAFPFVACLLWYQWVCFGNIWFPAQHYYFERGTIGGSGAFMSLPRPGVFFGVVLGARAGLLTYVPLALPAFWLLARPSRDEKSLPALRPVVAALCAAYLLYASCFTASVEYSYFGPRYLSPVMPLLCAALALRARRLDGPWLTSVLAASIAINVMGAQNGLYATNVVRVIGLWIVRGPWLPAVDQLRGEFGITSASPYGPLVLLSAVIALLWLPEIRRLRTS